MRDKNTLLTSLVFLCLAEYSQLQAGKKKIKIKKKSFQVFFTRFRTRTFMASSGLLSAILRSDGPVSGSPPALVWRMLSCHLSAFKAFRRRGPPGPSHARCVRQSGGSPPPPPPPSKRSTLYHFPASKISNRIFFFFFDSSKEKKMIYSG